VKSRREIFCSTTQFFQTVLYDNTFNHDVIVETDDGVPFCKSCNTDDRGHVGFNILLEQKFENDGSVLD
jgi:hypothetical protein